MAYMHHRSSFYLDVSFEENFRWPLPLVVFENMRANPLRSPLPMASLTSPSSCWIHLFSCPKINEYKRLQDDFCNLWMCLSRNVSKSEFVGRRKSTKQWIAGKHGWEFASSIPSCHIVWRACYRTSFSRWEPWYLTSEVWDPWYQKINSVIQ